MGDLTVITPAEEPPLVVQWAAAHASIQLSLKAGPATAIDTEAGLVSGEDNVARYILDSANKLQSSVGLAQWLEWKSCVLLPGLEKGPDEAFKTLSAAVASGFLEDHVGLSDFAIASTLATKPKILPPALAEYVQRVTDAAGEDSEDYEPVGDSFYLTTAINYTNGDPHFGHAYEAVVSDVITRYHRRFGRDVKFLTGTDEHGQKIADKAEAEGVQPIENCNKYAKKFQDLDAKLLVSYDDFIRTTQSRHKTVCHWLWREAKKSGDIYLDKYEGWYNVKEETFVTEAEAQQSDYKDAAGKPLQKRCEASYFFRMSKYQGRLVQHIKENPRFIQPANRRAEILARLDEPLRDLSISRTTFKWGIPVEDDPEHVMYVWFDALTNYLSAIGYPSGPEAGRWPANVQIIGKDISWFHTVIWPCMLFSTGVAPPKTVFAHGFVTDANNQKMSKSIGNVVDPLDVLKVFPADSLRYYIIRASPFGNDLPFSYQALADMHNGVLIKTLGNLVNRAVNITKKFCDGKVPDVPTAKPFDVDRLRDASEKLYATLKLRAGLEQAVAALSATNLYLTETEPWKCKDPVKRSQSVRTSLEAVYICAHFLAPVIPDATDKIFNYLGTPPRAIKDLKATFDNLAVGTPITVGELLFHAVDVEDILKGQEKAAAAAALANQLSPEDLADLTKKIEAQGNKVRELKTAKADKAEITKEVEVLKALKAKLPAQSKSSKESKPKGKKAQKATKADKSAASGPQSLYADVDIRVGKIVDVWEHPDSDKLWCERIDVGEDAPREIASGLRKFYTKEQMQDRFILTVCNLKPAKLGGFTSSGMVLCAKQGDAVEFVDPPAGSKPGDKVIVEGNEGTPLSASQMKKRKVFEKMAKDLKTDDAKVACYKGVPLTVNGQPCTAPSVVQGNIN